jgi:hypothetical protein
MPTPPEVSPNPPALPPPSRKRRYRLSPEGRRSPKALAARRANILRAHAADPDDIYRSTARRRAASRANLQKALAARRSPEGRAAVRLNAFQHGLGARSLPELQARLGEAPEDFREHLQQVRRVFPPEGTEEERLVERLARATWRRIRLFRAQARYDATAWRRMVRRAGNRRPTLQELSWRAEMVNELSSEARLVESETWKIGDRIERILEALLRARSEASRDLW